MTPSFHVERIASGDLTILKLNGFLDAHTAPDFEKAVQGEIEAGRVRLIADCAALSYISSAGLGVFMSFVEEIRENGGDFKICGLAPKVAQVFEILGFDSIFDIVPDLETASQRFASRAKEA